MSSKQVVERHGLTAMDDYINKVYRMVLLLIPGACQCAGLLYTFEKIMGWLPTVEWMPLIIFDVTCLIYLGIGFFFVFTGSKNGVVKPGKLLGGKIYAAIILLIQWNFIQYMIPATDFWGFAFFFVILTAFFLDAKLGSDFFSSSSNIQKSVLIGLKKHQQHSTVDQLAMGHSPSANYIARACA